MFTSRHSRIKEFILSAAHFSFFFVILLRAYFLSINFDLPTYKSDVIYECSLVINDQSKEVSLSISFISYLLGIWATLMHGLILSSSISVSDRVHTKTWKFLCSIVQVQCPRMPPKFTMFTLYLGILWMPLNSWMMPYQTMAKYLSIVSMGNPDRPALLWCTWCSAMIGQP